MIKFQVMRGNLLRADAHGLLGNKITCSLPVLLLIHV